ncbi:MAG TPA: alpha/beta hydrolase [Polyangiaceae bacterium]|nr:alpha/beta hydrolase [Polyangiaceae bacterium]
MSKIAHRRIRANGIDVHIAEMGRGPLVVLLHGFPDLGYAWRHQLEALADAGYHAVAPDLRGYGETDAPAAVEDYSMFKMIGDVVGTLDALDAKTAVLVGHDWGARIVWHAAQLHPERVSSVVALSVAFDPRFPTTRAMKQWSADKFNFALYFQKPGVAEAELEADPRRTLRLFFYALSGDAPPDLVPALFQSKLASAGALEGMPEPAVFPAWLTEADLDFYARTFARTGFRGALNRYRNMDRDAEELAPHLGLPILPPALFMAGEQDSAFRFATLDPMKAAVRNLRKTVVLPATGHWLQQERSALVNGEIVAFLRSQAPSAPRVSEEANRSQ